MPNAQPLRGEGVPCDGERAVGRVASFGGTKGCKGLGFMLSVRGVISAVPPAYSFDPKNSSSPKFFNRPYSSLGPLTRTKQSITNTYTESAYSNIFRVLHS